MRQNLGLLPVKALTGALACCVLALGCHANKPRASNKSSIAHPASSPILAEATKTTIDSPAGVTQVEVHFSPDEDLEQIDTQILDSAKSEISMSAYSFTDAEVVQAMEQAAERGVKIRIYRDHGSIKEELERQRAQTPAILELAQLPGVQVRIKHSSTLAHLKAYEVDGKILRTGSANFSPGAERHQDNDLVIILDQRSVIRFMAKFEDMWQRPDNEVISNEGTP